jgi:hypothetical protein
LSLGPVSALSGDHPDRSGSREREILRRVSGSFGLGWMGRTRARDSHELAASGRRKGACQRIAPARPPRRTASPKRVWKSRGQNPNRIAMPHAGQRDCARIATSSRCRMLNEFWSHPGQRNRCSPFVNASASPKRLAAEPRQTWHRFDHGADRAHHWRVRKCRRSTWTPLSDHPDRSCSPGQGSRQAQDRPDRDCE